MPRTPPVTSTIRPPGAPSSVMRVLRRGVLTAFGDQRMMALAAVMPAPKPTNRTRSPSVTRPASNASASARGTDPDDVLPVRSSTMAVLVHRQSEPVDGRGDDPGVGLVGDDERDVVGGDPGVSHRLRRRVDHRPNRAPEDLPAVHLHLAVDARSTGSVRRCRRSRGPRPASVPVRRPLRARPRRSRRRTGSPCSGRSSRRSAPACRCRSPAPCRRPSRSSRGPSMSA